MAAISLSASIMSLHVTQNVLVSLVKSSLLVRILFAVNAIVSSLFGMCPPFPVFVEFFAHFSAAYARENFRAWKTDMAEATASDNQSSKISTNS